MSTAASVWPRRSRTPPARARSGKTCPGRAKSCGRLLGSVMARIVPARSWAEMPVVMSEPFTSIETVNAVPPNAVLSGDIGASSNSSRLSPVMARQINPPSVHGHEVDGLGRDHFRRHGQVAFVLTVFIIHHDDHASGLKLA